MFLRIGREVGVRQDACDGLVPRIALPWRGGTIGDEKTHGTGDGDLRRGYMGFFLAGEGV